MSATNETEFRETAQPDAQPNSATSETVLLSVDEAASVFGISPQAVRKRISKGQLPARRDGRSWLVILDRETIATSETETDETIAQPRTKPGAQPGNLVATQQAEQMAALVASIQAPLLDRIEVANREAERERVEKERERVRADLAVQERDELAAEVELLREIGQAVDYADGTAEEVSNLEEPKIHWGHSRFGSSPVREGDKSTMMIRFFLMGVLVFYIGGYVWIGLISPKGGQLISWEKLTRAAEIATVLAILLAIILFFVDHWLSRRSSNRA
jgi:excisionase family DNA binding protein